MRILVLTLALVLCGCAGGGYLLEHEMWHSKEFPCPAPTINICSMPNGTYCVCEVWNPRRF